MSCRNSFIRPVVGPVFLSSTQMEPHSGSCRPYLKQPSPSCRYPLGTSSSTPGTCEENTTRASLPPQTNTREIIERSQYRLLRQIGRTTHHSWYTPLTWLPSRCPPDSSGSCFLKHWRNMSEWLLNLRNDTTYSRTTVSYAHWSCIYRVLSGIPSHANKKNVRRVWIVPSEPMQLFVKRHDTVSCICRHRWGWSENVIDGQTGTLQ